MDIFFEKRTGKIIIFCIALGVIIFLIKLHQNYNLVLFEQELIVFQVDFTKFNNYTPLEIRLISFKLPNVFKQRINLDSFVYNFLILSINFLLSRLLKQTYLQSLFLIFLMIILIILEKLSIHIYQSMNERYFRLIVIYIGNLRHFFEILPILPFLMDYFSRYPNLKPSKP